MVQARSAYVDSQPGLAQRSEHIFVRVEPEFVNLVSMFEPFRTTDEILERAGVPYP